MKYIVYETTNLVNNKIYIGVHKTLDPEVFDGYIGNGIYVTQPYTYKYSKTAFQCAVKKYGPNNFRRKTLAVFDTEKEASDLEEQLVNEKFLERPDVYNMILGGVAGCYISQRIKVYQYSLTGEYIQEHISFAEAAEALHCDYTLISYAVRKKSKAKGYLWSTDKLELLDLSNYNLGDNHQISISIYLLDGSYYKTFTNQTQAAKELGIATSTIAHARVEGNCVHNEYYICSIKAESYDKARLEYINTRPVFRYNPDGSFDKEYDTQMEAQLDNPKINITKAIKLKTSDKNGFIWGLEKLENYNKPKKKNAKRKVGKYTLDGELVTIYNSATAAAKENGTSVWKVLAGTNQTHKQHIYKYLE